ncbi:MAG: phenylalanine--tRNA ligase subunit beta [Candidatus Omnitrophota bacterium]
MRISYNWLKDYIDPNLAPAKLAETLTMAGLTTESVQPSGDDHLLEIEVTANRPDWLSYIGVARELAAITGNKLTLPPSAGINTAGKKSGIKIDIEEKSLCQRYTARVIKDVDVKESPGRLKRKLEAMDLRPVNNVVDITNFCLFETGEPMHAFDLDKIDGGQIIIRRARKGEKIVTIDGVERELNDTILVIADRSRPIAIAGVMGGLNTEVTGATKNVLLEAASFDPISARRTARALGISTESSYRFERKVDLDNIASASDRATSLICELASGQACEFIDIGKKSAGGKTITLRLPKLDAVLGLEIPPAKVKKISESLGLRIKKSTKESLTMDTPQFRYDLNAEIDIIEEIARIYGYNRIPSTIPAVVEQDEKVPFEMMIENRIRSLLAGSGADEIITYSLLSKNLLKMASLEDTHVSEIKNPLSSEQEIMRPSLMPGMLASILWNINRKSRDLELFELGKIYTKTSERSFNETRCLSIGIAGEISGWAQGARPCGFFDLKGAIETVLSELGIDNAAFKQTRIDGYSHSCAAVIDIKGSEIGRAGEISKQVLHNFDIKERIYFCEISLDALLKHAKLEKVFKELPKHPSVYRDMSLVVPKEVLNADIVVLARETAGAILHDIRLIDRFTGKQIPDGKVSLTYRLEYRIPSRTLEEKEVSAVHANILQALEKRYGARLR